MGWMQTLWNLGNGRRKDRSGRTVPVPRRPLCLEELEPRIVPDAAGNQLFLTKAYQNLLMRAIDPGGQAFFANALNTDALSRFQVALGLAQSTEYRTLQIDEYYQHYLNRAADPAGRQAALNFLAQGAALVQQEVALAGSMEYFVNKGGGTNSGFLDALYQDVLGRAADPAGKAAFETALAQGTSRATVAFTFLNSLERRQQVVTGFYQAFLNRAPDPHGFSVFVAALGNGQRTEQVIAAFLASEEYAPGAYSSYVLTAGEVETLLRRAAAASASTDAIIAVVDRGGRILGVRVEEGVSPLITGQTEALVFAIDGALAKARTAAFFANNQAPLTSRTVQFISQSTITQREVHSNPSITDPNSPFRGPGFVAPIGLGGHFPPNIPNTPPVDLFGIEHTNRDTRFHPGPDGIKGTADDVLLPNRFNVPDAFIPANIPASQRLTPPDSYGVLSGLMVHASPRGMATLPGGIPIYKKGKLVGGIGVFFPGTTGFATEENSKLSTSYNPALPDRSFEAEYIAFAAVGGSSAAGAAIGAIAGIPPLPGFDLPFGRIDLAGITLDIYGPGGNEGVRTLVAFGGFLGVGNPNSGSNRIVDPGPDGIPGTADDIFLKTGVIVPDGWLVAPHDGPSLSAADVVRIINQGIAEAERARAQIRLPIGSRTRMVFAVADTVTGEVLGLYRMPDATVFSLDVAVAKARNMAYYANPAQLQAIDQIPGLPPGVAFTSRTIRYLAQPRFPEGIAGTPPAPFSILNDGGVNTSTGLSVGVPLPASAFQSVYGFDAFNPGTNFRNPNNILNQNGIVFFPGSSALYKTVNGVRTIAGGLGVSGDGVDQDDLVTFFAVVGYEPPDHLRADQFFFNGVRLPYFRFPRNPHA